MQDRAPLSDAGLRILSADKEFQRILAEDAELRRLSAMRIDPAAETIVLFDVLGIGARRIGRLPVLPLTPGKWALLAALGSPFATGFSDRSALSASDCDLFLYILSHPDPRTIGRPLDALAGEAAGFSAATGLELPALAAEIADAVRTAFLPLRVLPPADCDDADGDGAPPFGADWIVPLASVAARLSGMPFLDCVWNLPLAACCALFVQFRRENDARPDRIRRRPNPALEAAMIDRTRTLAQERLERLRAATPTEPLRKETNPPCS